MSNNYFCGFYFKHQKGNNTVAFIPGKSDDTAFIQVITNTKSYNQNYPNIDMNVKAVTVDIGKCSFSQDGITIKMDNIFGKIRYTDLTPIKYDIMGPFKYFPMQCRHGVISMHHKLNGYLSIDNNLIDFTDGTGYIEMDSGNSFPSKYIWIQCNDFHHYNEKCSVMVSIADIPFLGTNFLGCICVVWYKNIEYRFATYLGVKIKYYDENKIVISQGKYTLDIDITDNNSHKLYAPQNGKMINIIRESNTSTATFTLSENKNVIFSFESSNTSFEYNM